MPGAVEQVVRRLAFVILVSLAGCGDASRDERSVSAAPVPRDHHDDIFRNTSLDASCADLAAARCADFVLCASFVDRAHFADEQACVASVTSTCIEAGNLPGVEHARERTEDCTRALRALDCNDRRDPDAQRRACTVPGSPPRGTLLDGAPCVDGAQCAGGACLNEGAQRCGVCASATAVGAACASTSDCGTNELVCTAGLCAARREVGAVCTLDAECRVGLSCLNEHCAIGTMTEGEVCIAGSNACDPREGLRCLGEEWTRCVRYEVLPVGGSCVGGVMGLPVLCGGPDAYCRTSDYRCVNRRARGEACTDDLECGEGALCLQLEGRSLCISTAEVCR